MSDWQLGIDFGTSYTVGAVAQDGNVSVVDIESDGRARIPSSVFLTQDGEILVGTAAQHQAVFAPERYEPTPKRSLGEGQLFLGDRLVAVTDLVAAVLRRVYSESCRQQGERAPSAVRVTHPAEWGATRQAVFREATEKAGLNSATLVPEPVAAAARIALQSTAPGQHVAVYDFGGGTFDAAVLLRTDDGFEVAGPPAGRDPLGGEDIDESIVNYLGQVLADEEPEKWSALRSAQDVAGRRNAAALRAEVQRAKETLSEITVCQLWVPGLERDVQLTRAELEQLIGAAVGTTVDTLEIALKDAGVSPDALAGLYLVGGSSRIPLVADAIWRRLGIRPSVQDNPKSVVAMGAAQWAPGDPARSDATGSGAPGSGAPTAARAEPATAVATAPREPEPASLETLPLPLVSPDAGMVPFVSPIVFSLERETWPAGCDCIVELIVDYSGTAPLTVRARDTPTIVDDAQQLSQQVLAVRAPRTPGFRRLSLAPVEVFGGAAGFECRFAMDTKTGPVTMVEQYAVVDGRAIVVAGPEAARSVLESFVVRPSRLPRDAWFEPNIELSFPVDWTVTQQLVLRRKGSPYAVTSTYVAAPRGLDPQAWREQQLAILTRPEGAKIVGEVTARVLDRLEGEIVTVQWNDGGTHMLSKAGLAPFADQCYGVAISLPHSEQTLFPALARHARLRP